MEQNLLQNVSNRSTKSCIIPVYTIYYIQLYRSNDFNNITYNVNYSRRRNVRPHDVK